MSIDNTSLVYLRADDISQIAIRKSNITGRTAESNSSFFVLQNSNIIISDSTFTNNSMKINSTKPTLLNASINSSISFVNCILSGNTGMQYYPSYKFKFSKSYQFRHQLQQSINSVVDYLLPKYIYRKLHHHKQPWQIFICTACCR